MGILWKHFGNYDFSVECRAYRSNGAAEGGNVREGHTICDKEASDKAWENLASGCSDGESDSCFYSAPHLYKTDYGHFRAD